MQEPCSYVSIIKPKIRVINPATLKSLMAFTVKVKNSTLNKSLIETAKKVKKAILKNKTPICKKNLSSKIKEKLIKSVPRTKLGCTIFAKSFGFFIIALARTGIICCIAPKIIIDKIPRVNRCTVPIALGEY